MQVAVGSNFLQMAGINDSSALKINFCLCRSIDHYETDLGGKATYGGHKITILVGLFALIEVYLH